MLPLSCFNNNVNRYRMQSVAPPSRPRLQSADRNVAVGSHGQYIPTLTAAAA